MEVQKRLHEQLEVWLLSVELKNTHTLTGDHYLRVQQSTACYMRISACHVLFFSRIAFGCFYGLLESSICTR